MSKSKITRAHALRLLGTSAGALLIKGAHGQNTPAFAPPAADVIYSLNMATIRGQKLGFWKELETASAAGFHAVEIWMDSLEEYLVSGGKITEIKKRLDDWGLKIVNCISFNEWIVNDDARRKKGLEQMRSQMELLAELGCPRIAATGKGATNNDVPALDTIAERYRVVLDMGAPFGIVPQLEMWGFLKNLSDAAETVYIAMRSGNPAARILLDIFHFYRGNTNLDTLWMMSPDLADILHMNDYPAGMPWQTITDADRVYPGDGIAPIKPIVRDLLKNRKKPLILSTELFNPSYYRQDALTVAKTSLAKMKKIVADI